MRACIAAIILVVCSPGGLVHAQSGTDVSPAIPVHPDVSTVLQLPDAVEGVWSIDGDEIMVQGAGSEIYVRPRPDTPAGVEAFVEVKTRTLHRMFLLRVVARAEDARRHVLVRPVAAQAPGESTPEAPPDEPTKPEAPPDEPAEPEAPALAVTPEIAELAACAPTSMAAPTPKAGVESAEPAAERDSAADMKRGAEVPGASRFDLTVHAVGGLGFTGVNIAGYWSDSVLQPHHFFGLRLTGEARSTPWAVQAEVSAEWPAGPMKYQGPVSPLAVSGSRLRLELGTRASAGTKWRASVYAGIGIQVHLRRTAETIDLPEVPTSTMEQGVVLGLGVGLQYQTRSKVLLGIDFLVRQGGPDDYHSVTALLTVGRFLDQGDRP